jgi:pyruvate/2-oxoglutarate dehydrogenase complex dihydrolipoamide acyltransferase (E2) component
MALDVVMPQMGESVVEGTIAKWLVKEGDQVREDQPLVEISTDKVDTEIPSPAAGTIAKILVSEGQTVPVGARLAVIEGAAGAAVAAGKAATAAPAAPPAKPAARPPLSPAGARPAPGAAVAATAEEAAPPRAASSAEPPGEGVAAAGPRRYSPVVLRMAAQHAIDLSRVPGSGIEGRVTRRDVERYLESLGQGQVAAPTADAASARAAPARAPAVTAGAAPGVAFRPPLYEPREGDVVEPFSRRRKVIAEHMVFSKTHAPHVGTVAEVDMTGVVRLREAHKDAFAAREGFALTILPIVAAATVRVLKEFPRMNASVAGDSLIIRKTINLGIAMDDMEGLLVPVIKSAEGMSVMGLAREIENLRRKIAEKRITADDLAGGSFTLSNPGREGNLYGFAIINQPQVGILRMGELKRRAVVIEVDGENAIAIRTMMYLALSYDHRVIDGVLANRFLNRVGRVLEEADFEL